MNRFIKCLAKQKLTAFWCSNMAICSQNNVVCCQTIRGGKKAKIAFYNALFIMRDGIPVRLCEDRAISTAKLVEDIENQNKTVFIVGDGAALCYNSLENFEVNAILAPEPMRHQSAWGVCMAAKREPAQSVHELLPVYLRLSQAERERQERIFGR